MRALLVICAVVAVTAGASSVRADAAPPVLFVGDSIATGIQWHDPAVQAMQQNLAVEWQVEICRTVGGTSCPFDGQRPPTLLDLIAGRPNVPPIDVVELGYNDPAAGFADGVDQAMAALVAKGAQHVLWLTLRAVRTPYPALNAVLEHAAKRWPQLELVDWNAAGAGNYAWFQSDGVHLLASGGLAMAHLVHAAVMRIVDPLRVVTPPLRLRDGHAYAVHLRATGGTPPYRWGVARGRPPHGFHLLADGTLNARPPTGARATFDVSVTDADGVTAELRVDAG